MDHDVPVAVVGLSYRAPGVGRKGLWEFLEQARSAWTEFPPDRFDQKAYWNPGNVEKSGAFRTKGAHFLSEDVYAFDAAFFHMRVEEARASDPQHRMMLECALEAAEDAGKTLLDLAGKNVGVFMGAGQNEYAQRLGDDDHTANTMSATGVSSCMLANRISYFFDIGGPSVVLDAACASSVYAAHQAVSALQNEECSAAFLGSATLSLTPGNWLALEKTGALSTHGRSYSYDVKAAGFGRGEGAACLLLKRLDDAIRDGDPIRAVIRSSACNHGGRSEGITMPNGVAHRKLLRMVHERAGLDPGQTPVVEGHGTGTAAGDPIEASAFAAVLGKGRTSSNPIYIGSIKSNFGHLEGASGVLGMIKAILMLEHECILPTAGFEKMNPKIRGQDKLVVPICPIPWPSNEPRRVLVTNFGFGGSNSAILLEAAAPWVSKGIPFHVTNDTDGTDGAHGSSGPENVCETFVTDLSTRDGMNIIHASETDTVKARNVTNMQISDGDSHLFVFSARTAKSLDSYVASFSEYLEEAPQSSHFAHDLSYTLGQRRTQFPYRLSVVAKTLDSLQEKLAAAPRSRRARDQTLAFAFSGQGAQYAQMASGLWQYKTFANTMERAEKLLHGMGATWSLKEELEKLEATSAVNDAEVSQPSCTAVQLALLALLDSWDIKPAAVAGHSSGEIAAAYSAGLITFEAAIAVAYFRGRAAAALIRDRGKSGAMLAVGVSSDEAEMLIQEHSDGHYATIAAINSPKAVTISGDNIAIDNILKAAEEEGLFVRKLNVQLAYHSRHMHEVASSYLQAVEPVCSSHAQLSPKSEKPEVTVHPVFVSSVTGQPLDPGIGYLDASYWVRNLIQPVKFAEAIQNMLAPTRSKFTTGEATKITVPSIIIEIGPHSALKNPIKQNIAFLVAKNGLHTESSFTYLPTLLRESDDKEALLRLAGSLFNLGVAPLQLGEVNQTSMHNARVVNNLPAYAWDKSVSYEVRPRTTHEGLFPGVPWHALLGRKEATQGGKQHVYRQVFNLDEIPWLRDHVVADVVIFPMTGYMACAIEAARRTVTPPAASLLIQEFHIERRLELQEDGPVELVTRIRPLTIGSGAFSSKVWSFEISSWTKAVGWTVHAYGRIEPEMEEMNTDTPTLQAALKDIDTTAGLIEWDIAKMYESAGVRATQYGPAFRNSARFFEGQGYTVLEHHLRNLGPYQQQSEPYGSPVSVDPPTLDGFLQGGGPLQLMDDGSRPAQMPNYISRFRISNKISSRPKQRFDVVTRLLDYDFKGGRMRISVAVFARHADGTSPNPVAEWESITFRSIEAAEDEASPAADMPDNWQWELLPRIDLMRGEDVEKQFRVGTFDEMQYTRINDLETAASYYLYKILQDTAGQDRSDLPAHFGRFLSWSERYVVKKQVKFDAEPTALLDKVRGGDAQGQLLCAVGERLLSILRQETETLELMLADGLLSRHYEADPMTQRLSRVIGDIVLSYSNLETNLRILEIGGGTAGTTLPVLEALSKTKEQGVFLNYTFTDISSGFFENARTKLGRWSQRITYKRLDISQDPLAQGFEAGEFDIVIAANVLHATANMPTTMSNVRQLLKPGGKLVVLEGHHHPALAMPFVLLPGWWYAEDDYRDSEEGPLMSVDVWNRLLIDTGFSGVDARIQGRLGLEDFTVSIMCSQKVTQQELGASITICGPFMNDAEVSFAQKVAGVLSDRLGLPVETTPFAEIDPSSSPSYVVIDSPEHSILRDVSAEKFETLKTLLLHNQGLLWAIPESDVPETKLIKGILRTLRIESGAKSLLCLDQVPCTDQGISGILKLIGTLLDPKITCLEDQDFVWQDGSIYLPRMRMLEDTKERFAAEQQVSFRKEQNIWNGDRALEMTIDVAGSAESIYFRRTETLQQPLADGEIIIKVHAAGLSRRDLDLVLGAIPWAPPGFDGAGEVVRVGDSVSHLQAGDRILFLSLEGSGFSTYKKIPAWHAARVPANMTTTDAASIPLAYSLAVLALVRTARLRKNETVLIHSAAGAVGQACVAVARHIGARILATAGTSEKREFMNRSLGIPAEDIFSSCTTRFRDAILCATRGKGADVIVNSFGGERLVETWALAADFGRFVQIDKKSAFQDDSLPMKTFERNVSFSSIDLRDLYQQRPAEVKEVFDEVLQLMGRRVVVPIKNLKFFPISRLFSALRKLKVDEHAGKIIITLGQNEQVMAESALRPTPSSLKTDATYLITGGTRGIGLNLAYWLTENGARNIVVLGRSGGSGSEVQKLLEKFQGTDVVVRALSCDIASREQLATVVESIRDLPPVCGVIHSALLLSDKIFQNSVYQDWETIMGPRVQGAWNLHELMPGNLDFFIVLGSFLGETGNGGQAIYGGTAAFYDAFAQYRSARGQHTVSLCLPVVMDVGYVADRSLGNTLRQTLGATLTMANIRTIVKGVICKLPGFYDNAKATLLKLYVEGQRVQNGPWQYLHPVHAVERLRLDKLKNTSARGVGAGMSAASWATAENPLESLTEALITKVAAMAVMDGEDIQADAPVASHNLDSLVSVELRNWIRRETGVELPLTSITHAASLRALAAEILEKRSTH
ncbi:Type I Iterative PKS [Claviceps pusilla]|uniref:Type I Iterative PKS n=1 Tax=Claviceps pusilla TaxID=123648 RepID=A0A9P7T2W6_9HYPO|nr:Type I Iterative PKS [Claviceps pusilla]